MHDSVLSTFNIRAPDAAGGGQAYELGFTQERFAAKCQVHGFDISRATFSQIEAQLRCISDLELLLLARVLKVSTDDLFPPKMRRRKRR